MVLSIKWFDSTWSLAILIPHPQHASICIFLVLRFQVDKNQIFGSARKQSKTECGLERSWFGMMDRSRQKQKSNIDWAEIVIKWSKYKTTQNIITDSKHD